MNNQSAWFQISQVFLNSMMIERDEHIDQFLRAPNLAIGNINLITPVSTLDERHVLAVPKHAVAGPLECLRQNIANGNNSLT